MTTQMKALDEYSLMVLFTLLLNRVHVFALFMKCLIWIEKHGSEWRCLFFIWSKLNWEGESPWYSHAHPLCFANQRISQNIPHLSSQSKMNNHCFGIPMLLISLDFVHNITSLINKRAITGITTRVMWQKRQNYLKKTQILNITNSL